jgi:hypothetical protein
MQIIRTGQRARAHCGTHYSSSFLTLFLGPAFSPHASPGIPFQCLQHNLCDMVTRACIRGTISPNNVQALDADCRAREAQLERALTTYFDGAPPPRALLKTMQATVLPLRLTKVPSLQAVCKVYESTDAFGNKLKTLGLTHSTGLSVLAAAFAAAWAELNWAPFGELVSFIAMAVGTADRSTDDDQKRVILHLAAETWSEGLKRGEHGADLLRCASHAPTGGAPLEIFGSGFSGWLESNVASFRATTRLATVWGTFSANRAPSSSLAESGSKKTPGKINDHIAEWQSFFPGVCAFHHLNHKGCSRGDDCPHKDSHKKPISDQSKLDKFKQDHGFSR